MYTGSTLNCVCWINFRLCILDQMLHLWERLSVGNKKPSYTDNTDSLPVCLSACLSVCLSVCLSACMSVFSDSANPVSVFVVPQRNPPMEEGRDFLFECLVTDRSVTKLALRREQEPGLPSGMRVTLDPRRGALIRDLSPAYSATRYVCSAQKDGKEFTSTPVNLQVVCSTYSDLLYYS